jgi:hypothetical protein
MAVNAKFIGDFASFQDAVAKSEVSLKSFAEGANKVGPALNRMVDNFSGRKLIQEAEVMTRAIEVAGGQSTLTGEQLRVAGNKAAEAAEKMKKLGMEVPPGLENLAATTQKSSGFISQLGTEIVKTAAGFITAQAVITGVKMAFDALVGAARGAIEFGSHLDDLSKSTNIGVENLQALGFAGKRVGVELDEIGALVGSMSKRIATGDGSAVAAVQSLGFNLKQFRSLAPEDQFVELAEAIGKITDPLVQAGIGSELFGKQFQTVVRLSNDGLRETMQAGKDTGAVLGADAVATLDRFGDALGDLTTRTKVLVISALTPFIEKLNQILLISDQVSKKTFIDPKMEESFKKSGFALQEFEGPIEQLGPKITVVGLAAKQLAGGMAVGSEAARILANRVKALDEEYQSLTASDKAQIASNLKRGLSEAEIAKTMGISAETMKRVTEAQKAGAEAAKKAAEEWKKFLDHLHEVEGTKADFKTLALADALKQVAKTEAAPTLKDLSGLALQAATDFSGLSGSAEDLGRAGRHAAVAMQEINKQFATLPNVVPQNTKLIKDAADMIDHSFANASIRVLGSISAILGGIRGKFAEVVTIAARTGEGIANALMKGDVWGAAIAGITGAVGIIVKLFSNAEKQVNPVRQAFVNLAGGLDALNLKAFKAGTTLTAMLNARTPEAYKKAIDDLNAAFQFQDDTMKFLDDTVSKYGFTIEQLGPKFAAQKLVEQAANLEKEYEALTAAGVFHNAIIEKMGPSMQAYIDKSQEAGVAIPENMRKTLQTFVDAGALTDKAGNKMTDLSSLTFSEDLDTKFNTLIGSIKELVDVISRNLGTALVNLGNTKVPPIHVPIVYDDPGFAGHGAEGAARGGVVTSRGIQSFAGGGRVLAFRPRGTDTVPAMLTPGETVRTAAQEAALGNADIGAKLDNLAHILMFRAPQQIAKAVVVANVKAGRR